MRYPLLILVLLVASGVLLEAQGKAAEETAMAVVWNAVTNACPPVPEVSANQPPPASRSGQQTFRAYTGPFNHYDFSYANDAMIANEFRKSSLPDQIILDEFMALSGRYRPAHFIYGQPYDMTRSYGYLFVQQVIANLSPNNQAAWGDALLSAATNLLAAGQDCRLLYGAELAAAQNAANLDGKYAELASIYTTIFKGLGKLDGGNAEWVNLRTPAINASGGASLDAYNANRKVSLSLRDAFCGAISNVPDVTLAYAALKSAGQDREELQMPALVDAISYQATPAGFLKDHQALINAQLKFDETMFKELQMPGFARDPEDVKLIDAVYPVLGSVQSYKDYLEGGRTAYQLEMLKDIAADCQTGAGGMSDLDTAKPPSELIIRQMGNTVDKIAEFKDRWVSSHQPEKLYAAISVDAAGEPLPTEYAWVTWTWLDADDLSDLKDDGRIINGLGDQWLAPAGSTVQAVTSYAQASDNNLKKIIVALDTDRLAAP